MLTDLKCKAAQPAEKPYKLSDQHGLYLQVQPTGYKGWKLKYRMAGRERKLSFGPYPEVKLTEARDRMFEARALLRRGIDPAAPGAQPESSRTFGEAAARWLSLQKESWKPKYARTVEDRLDADILPILGNKPLEAVRPRDILQLLDPVQERGAVEVAHRLRNYCNAIYECAIALDWAETNPAASIGKALRPKTTRHFPALLDLRRARSFLKTMEAQPCQPATKLASRLLALSAARPGTIRMAQREEFEGLGTPDPIWRIPAAKMKLERAASEQDAFDFVIPLSRQAVELVEAAIEFSGRRKYLFPSSRYSHRPFSENGLNSNYRRVPGFEGRHVPHGWRSSFATIMNERAADLDRPADRAIIDLMLAHKPPGVEGIYNRAAYMRRRRELAQEWADLLCEGLVPASELVDGPRKSQPTR